MPISVQMHSLEHDLLGGLIKFPRILGVWMVSDLLQVIWGPSETSATQVTPSHACPVGDPNGSKVCGERDLQPKNLWKGNHGLCSQALSRHPSLQGRGTQSVQNCKASGVGALGWLGREASPLSVGQ